MTFELRLFVSSPLFPPKLHHGLPCGVAEETTEVGNVVVVHPGGDLLDGEVGFGEVAFELVNNGLVDEGFGGGLHQAVADFVQIIGTDVFVQESYSELVDFHNSGKGLGCGFLFFLLKN